VGVKKLDLDEQIEMHFINQPENDDQSKLCLSMGIPIYYTENNIQENHIIKEYPNGKRQLILCVDMETKKVIKDDY